MTTPYWQSSCGRYTLYHGDCLDILPGLEAGSVDAVVTDPPYSSGGAHRSDRMTATTAKYVSSGTIGVRHEFSGDNRDQRGYLAWVSLWLSHCLRISSASGMACLFTDWRQLPITTDAFQCGGWVWRGVSVWDKTLKARPAPGVFTSQAEYIVWGTCGRFEARPTGKQIPGVFACPAPDVSGRDHITQKPEPVMDWVMSSLASGAMVLDPFVGSGSTGVSAVRTNRRFVGIEIEERYCEIAAKRIEKEASHLFAEAV